MGGMVRKMWMENVRQRILYCYKRGNMVQDGLCGMVGGR